MGHMGRMKFWPRQEGRIQIGRDKLSFIFNFPSSPIFLSWVPFGKREEGRTQMRCQNLGGRERKSGSGREALPL